MKNSARNHIQSVDAGSQPGDLLSAVEKAAGAIVRHVKRLRDAAAGGDAAGAHVAIKELREEVAVLGRSEGELAARESAYANQADKQFLELEFGIREACAKRGWRVDGQWPTLYVERAVAVEVSEPKRSVTIGGKKLAAPTVESTIAALEPLVRDLVPKGFSPAEFMRALAAAYDSTKDGSAQLPVFDLYRGLVVHTQGARFWRDARTEAFVGLSADQFRARLTAALEQGVTAAPDGREVRLLPPLNPKDGMFMYQPAETRYGFVGRIEFVPATRPEAA